MSPSRTTTVSIDFKGIELQIDADARLAAAAGGAARFFAESAGLTSEEATSFGPVLARLSSALRDVCGAETVYTIALGDNSMHFHTLLIPRAADAPPELRGPGLLAKAPELVNHDEAHRIADLLRSRVASD